jgi:hypothetical protein
MNQDPRSGQTCDICQQPFSSEQELQNHQSDAHGQSGSGNNQSNYDTESDQPNERKIA